MKIFRLRILNVMNLHYTKKYIADNHEAALTADDKDAWGEERHDV